MNWKALSIVGVYLLEPDRHEDERGFFARTWCADECRRQGLETPAWIQCSISQNRRAGTVRGLHYQADPHGEIKLVRCGRGAIWDVLVDVREASPTRFQWLAVELNERNGFQLLIPTGIAHGFQTLTDDTEVSYSISTRYIPEAARGLRWNDPRIGITWPSPPTAISDRDAAFPLLEAQV